MPLVEKWARAGESCFTGAVVSVPDVQSGHLERATDWRATGQEGWKVIEQRQTPAQTLLSAAPTMQERVDAICDFVCLSW